MPYPSRGARKGTSLRGTLLEATRRDRSVHNIIKKRKQVYGLIKKIKKRQNSINAVNNIKM